MCIRDRNLYAEIAGPLYRKEDAEGSAKLDTIENALHGIRDRIWELQIQYKPVSYTHLDVYKRQT